VRMILV